MSDETRVVPVPRPEPPRSMLSRANDWLAWFGLGRLLLAAISVLVVAGGAFWLLRAPTPSVESTLPIAGANKPPPSSVVETVTSTTKPVSMSPDESSSSSAHDAGPTLIVVHVAGAVVHPGVYNLASSARMIDAVNAAGGASPEADTDRVNLAATIEDGQRVFVPIRGGTVPAEIVTSGSTGGSTGKVAATGTGNASGDTAAPSGPLDLNTATVDQLDLLPGIGPATAAAIVEDRDRNGPFSSVEDLDRVTGIGPAKLAALSDLVTV